MHKLTFNGQKLSETVYFYPDKKQDITATVTLDSSGEITFVTRFSNGKRVDGDHFFAKLVLVDTNSNVVAVSQIKRGLNASFGGKTVVKTASKSANLGAATARRAVEVQVSGGLYDTVNDREWWKKTIKEAEKLFSDSEDDGMAIIKPGKVAAVPPPKVF